MSALTDALEGLRDHVASDVNRLRNGQRVSIKMSTTLRKSYYVVLNQLEDRQGIRVGRRWFADPGQFSETGTLKLWGILLPGTES